MLHFIILLEILGTPFSPVILSYPLISTPGPCSPILLPFTTFLVNPLSWSTPHPLPQSHLPQSNTEIVLVILHHKKHLFITQRRLELHASLCHSPKSFWHIASPRKINPCSPILLPFTMILVNPLSWTPLPSSCHMFYSTHIRNAKQEMHTNNVAINEGFEVEFYKHGIHPLVHHIVDLFNHVVRIGF